mgnify:CR=1 FL=1
MMESNTIDRHDKHDRPQNIINESNINFDLSQIKEEIDNVELSNFFNFLDLSFENETT